MFISESLTIFVMYCKISRYKPALSITQSFKNKQEDFRELNREKITLEMNSKMQINPVKFF